MIFGATGAALSLMKLIAASLPCIFSPRSFCRFRSLSRPGDRPVEREAAELMPIRERKDKNAPRCPLGPERQEHPRPVGGQADDIHILRNRDRDIAKIPQSDRGSTRAGGGPLRCGLRHLACSRWINAFRRRHPVI